MENSIDGVWSSCASEVKASVWGDPLPDADEFHQAKYWSCAANGAIPDWSMQAWLSERWAGYKKTGTRNAASVTHPRGISDGIKRT